LGRPTVGEADLRFRAVNSRGILVAGGAGTLRGSYMNAGSLARSGQSNVYVEAEPKRRDHGIDLRPVGTDRHQM
jgi:hypothetical protein